MEEGQNSTADGLRRQLDAIDLAAIFVGIILGSGIFIAPKYVAASAPGVAAASALWIAGGAVAACGAFCYAECASRLPRTGGFYVYFHEVYGPPVAFVAGWAAVLVTYPASIAAIALILAQYVVEVIPSAGGVPAAWIAAAGILAAALVNALGVRMGIWTQRVLTSAKVGALLLLTIAALVAAASGRVSAPSTAGVSAFAFKGGALGALGAMVGILWTYDGWSDITLAAGEVKDPARNIGRAVFMGTGALVFIYVMVQISVLLLMGPERAASSERVLAEAVQTGLGWVSGQAVALLVVVSTLGSINGVTFASSRLAFAVSRDAGALLARIATVHPRFGSPNRAIALITVASLLYVFTASFSTLLSFFSFAVWLFYSLVAIALLILRRRKVGDETQGWRAPGGIVPPLVVISTGLAMTTYLMRDDPKRSLIGLALLLAGFPVYFLSRLGKKAG